MYEWQSTIKLPKCLLYLYCKRSKITNIAKEGKEREKRSVGKEKKKMIE